MDVVSAQDFVTAGHVACAERHKEVGGGVVTAALLFSVRNRQNVILITVICVQRVPRT